MGAFDWVQKSWAFNFKFAGLSVIFWLLLFAYEFYVDIPVIGQIPGGPGILEQALVRSFSFSGVIFISLALLSSVAFKFRPLLSKYAFVRKNLGVMGFIFVLFHVLAATQLYFMGDVTLAYFSLDPFVNPIIFGSLAFPILFIMAITSINWVEHKIGGTWWKALHRLVYFAFLFMVFHATRQNPAALTTLPGYVMLVLFAAVLLGQIYWWFNVSKQRGFRNPGFYIGLLVILLYLLIGYLAFFAR